MAKEKEKIYKVTADTSEAVNSMNQVTDAANQTEDALKGVEQQADKTANAVDGVGDAAKDSGDKAKEGAEASEGAFKVLDEFTGGLATKVKEVGGGFLSMGKKAVSAFKSAVTGANAMGKALIATGIGAIVVALGLIVAYWDDIVGAISGVSADQKQLLEDTQATADAQQDALESLELSENSLKLAGKSEREIRDLKIQQTEEVINATEMVLEQQKQQAKAQEDAMKRNNQIAQNLIRLLLAPITLILKAVDMATAAISKIPGVDIATNLEEGFSGGIADLIFDPEETAAEGQATIDETEKTLAQLRSKRDGYRLANQKEDEAASQKRRDDAAKEAEELAKIDEQIRKMEQDALLASIENEEERARKKAEIDKENALREIEESEATEEQKNKLRLLAEEKYNQELEAIQKTADEKELAEAEAKAAAMQAIREGTMDEREAEIAAVEAYYDDLIAQAEKYGLETEELTKARNEAIGAVNDSYRQSEIEKERAIFEAKAQAVSDGLNIISDLVSTFAGESEEEQKRAFNIQKGINIATATIDTYTAATGVLAAATANPATILFPGFPAIQAGLIVAAGLANVAKIAKTKFEPSGGGGGSDAGGGGGAPTPSKFSQGGLLTGRSHAQGGIMSPFGELEGGEFIVNRNSTQSFLPMLEQMNSLGQGQQRSMGNLSSGQENAMMGQAAPVIKTYVVASEMSSEQEANKRISDIARL